MGKSGALALSVGSLKSHRIGGSPGNFGARSGSEESAERSTFNFERSTFRGMGDDRRLMWRFGRPVRREERRGDVLAGPRLRWGGGRFDSRAMNRAPAPTPLLLGGVLALAAAGLMLLMIGVAGDRAGMELLPSAHARTEILPDPGQKRTWEEIRALPAGAWEAWTRPDDYIHIANGGAIWVRVTLGNATAEPLAGVLTDAEFNLDRLDCWTRDEAVPGGWRQRTSGESIPARARGIWGREPAFEVVVPARGETVVYLRAHDRFAVKDYVGGNSRLAKP